jgi:hypothetical protein
MYKRTPFVEEEVGEDGPAMLNDYRLLSQMNGLPPRST